RCVHYRAVAPPAGVLDVPELSLAATATPTPPPGQASRGVTQPPRPGCTASMPCTLVTVQTAASPVGLPDVTTLPLPSTATQRLLLGHDTPESELVPSTWVTFQAAAPPVGLLEVTTLPRPSTATQRLLLGQDTSANELEASTWITFHAAAPPVGLLEVTTLPL